MFDKFKEAGDRGFGEKKTSGKNRRQQAAKALKTSFSSKNFRLGGYSVLTALVVIGIAVVINLAANQLPTKATNYDLTASDVLSLSDQTKEITAALDQDVTIYDIVQSGNEDETISQLLDRYKDLSDHITVKSVDPVVYPNFASQYTSEEVSENSLIVVCGEKSRYIGNEDIYETSYNSDYSTNTTFDGEGELTSAIQYVASGTSGKIYLLTGHGEADIPDSVTEAIAKENMDLEELSLLKEGSVPDDASSLMIFSPSSDISSEEKDTILAYLAKGGSLMLITDYVDDQDMTNLYALEAAYGVKTADGIVMEGSASNCVQNYNYYLLPEIDSHEITDPLINGGYNVLMPLAQGILETGDAANTVTITPLLTTSDQAYSKVAGSAMNTYDKEDGDIDGPFNLGVAISEDLSNESTDEADTGDTEDGESTETADEGASDTSKIVFFSSSAFLEDSVSELVSGANLDLFVNSIGYLCDRESSVSIHAKALSSSYLTVSSAASSFWALIVIAVIPGCFLIIGIVKWIRRRKK